MQGKFLILRVFKKGYIKKERDWQKCKKESRLQKLNETELLQIRMPYFKLFIVRKKLLSAAFTHPAIRHPSKYIYTEEHTDIHLTIHNHSY